jgi:hypothetical protein
VRVSFLRVGPDNAAASFIVSGARLFDGTDVRDRADVFVEGGRVRDVGFD